MLIVDKSDCGLNMWGTIPKSGFEVITTTLKWVIRHKKQKESVQGSSERLGKVRKEGEIFLTPFLSNAVHPQPLDWFQRNDYQKLQVRVLLSNSQPEFENPASEETCIQNDTRCKFLENVLKGCRGSLISKSEYKVQTTTLQWEKELRKSVSKLGSVQR